VSATSTRPDVVLQAVAEERRWASPDGRFAVWRVQHGNDEVVVVGDLAGVESGEDVRFRGQWETHPKYGKRFRAHAYTPVLPTTQEGMTRFLGSGLIPGVGKRLAQRLVGAFGDRTLDVIATQSARLREIDGIGKKRASAISLAVKSRRDDAESFSFLYALGLGPAISRRVMKKYGERTAAVLKDDPYRVAEEVPGVGFRTADDMGRKAGIAVDDPRRAAGAVLYLVRRGIDEGHTFLPRGELRRAAEELEVPTERLEEAIDGLEARGALVCEGERVYAPEMRRAERAVATRLAALSGEREAPPEARAVEGLSASQRAAVDKARTHRSMVLTGGPGTGKTTTTKAIVEAFEGGFEVALAAPTGRAAKRLSEATGREASTLHRLLEWSPHTGTFQRNAHEPLDLDLLLIDEASMLDLLLAQAVLEALPPHAGLILVGDTDQLPPVGAGQVLREVLRTERVPTVRLTEVFRQAQESAIVTGAHAILAGRPPATSPRGQRGPGDLFVVRAQTPEEVEGQLLAALQRIPPAYGIDVRREVQVLCPMHRGPFGTRRLNQVLQGALNPGPGEAGQLRPGDKVMQLRNDYDREVFNGDLAWVRRVEDGVTYAEFDDGGLRSYPADDLDALTLAYVSTIHKAQGSEFPGVVLVLHGAHHVMLSRSLLYTAVTRAKRLCVIVGQPEAVRRAARTARRHERHSHLGARLVEALEADA
jgi:exodeoxyribonuclease V alpha subunit